MGEHSYKSVKLRLLGAICSQGAAFVAAHPEAAASLLSRAASVFLDWVDREEAATAQEREASRIENENTMARYAAEEARAKGKR